jgi:hypothetical protein
MLQMDRSISSKIFKLSKIQWERFIMYTNAYRILTAIKLAVYGYHLYTMYYLDGVIGMIRSIKIGDLIEEYDSLLKFIIPISVTNQMAQLTNQLMYSNNIGNIKTVCEIYSSNNCGLIETIVGNIMSKSYLDIVNKKILNMHYVFNDIRIKTIMFDDYLLMYYQYMEFNINEQRQIICCLLKYEMYRSMCRNYAGMHVNTIIKSPIMSNLIVKQYVKSTIIKIAKLFDVGKITRQFISILDHLMGFQI